MRDYQQNDYALNKFSKGIVYPFVDGAVEITLADYLSENPGKTEQDFIELRELSNDIYYRQDRDEYNQTRLDVPLYQLGGQVTRRVLMPDELYIEKQDRTISIP